MPDMWTESPTHLVRPVAVRRNLAHDLRLVTAVANDIVGQLAAAGPSLYDWADDPDLTDDCPPRGIVRPKNTGRFSTVWGDAS